MSQNEQILQMLREGPVGFFDALNKANAARLPARIKNLRDRGHEIYTEMVRQNGKRFGVYHLIKEKKMEAA